MAKIGFLVQGREILSNGMVKISIGLLNSTKSQLGTNELPIILNSIKQTHLLDPTSHIGFDYTLDFPLAAGHGFPYALDFVIESETNRNLT